MSGTLPPPDVAFCVFTRSRDDAACRAAEPTIPCPKAKGGFYGSAGASPSRFVQIGVCRAFTIFPSLQALVRFLRYDVSVSCCKRSAA
jgi:hypothetical protein